MIFECRSFSSNHQQMKYSAYSSNIAQPFLDANWWRGLPHCSSGSLAGQQDFHPQVLPICVCAKVGKRKVNRVNLSDSIQDPDTHVSETLWPVNLKILCLVLNQKCFI